MGLDGNLVMLITWTLIILGLIGLNTWAKRRGRHVVLDFNPANPIVHMEEAEFP